MKLRQRLITPRSLAVLGASQKPGIGKAIIENIHSMGYTGELFAVNVRGEDVLGVKGYRSVCDIPCDVDAAVIAVSSAHVQEVAEDCGKKGVKALICIAAGFKELGADGALAEDKLLSIVHQYNMCMVGPNCMGVINTDPAIGLNATINSMIPRRGNVAMLTQSGALGAALMDFADYLDIGFSVIVSTGNQADMNICDFLELVEEDRNTRVVLLYMESIPDPVRFRSIVTKMTKPVVVLKSGRTVIGARAAGSHTGSLAGNDAIADAILRQAGCIRAKTLEDAYLLVMTLSKLDIPGGRRVGIVSNTGGIDILLSDTLTELGFQMPELPQKCADELRPILMPEASIRNPMDIVAPARPAQYEAAVRAMIESGVYDAVLVVSVPAATVDTREVGAVLAPTLRNAKIPVLTCFYGQLVGSEGKEELRRSGIASYEYPEKMAELLNYICPKPQAKRRNRSFPVNESSIELCRRIVLSNKGMLPVKDAELILRVFGIPTADSGYLTEASDIRSLSLTYPVAAKVDHPEILHKSDAGGVRLGIESPEELAAVFTQWQLRFPGMRGVFVQEQLDGICETIIGAITDPVLGHGVAVGVGGTMVELMRDVSFGHVPVSETDAADMLSRLRCYPMYKGYRGMPETDTAGLEEIIVRVSQMLERIPEIRELDINPLMFDLRRSRFLAVDFRILT